MYCKNCHCAGCQKVPSIAALRGELRDLRRRKAALSTQVKQAEKALRTLPDERWKALVAKEAAERGVQPGLLVMEQSLDDLVRLAEERVNFSPASRALCEHAVSCVNRR